MNKKTYSDLINEDLYKALIKQQDIILKAYNDHVTQTGALPQKLILPIHLEFLGMTVEFTHEENMFTQTGFKTVVHVVEEAPKPVNLEALAQFQ